MADLYAQVGAPTQWCLVQQYADGSSVISVWGPFPDERSAVEAEPKLRDVIESGDWKVMPLRRVLADPDKPVQKPPVMRGDVPVTRE